MTLNEYQNFARQGIHPETLKREPITAFALGLAGEAGEVIDDIKKRIFHGRDIPIEHTMEELGDVMWYVANIATELGLSLESILDKNVAKLQKRYETLYTSKTWADNTDTHECVLAYGIYQGKQVAFTRSGPHIKMYDFNTNKFIKFLNKEEKIHYGFTENRSTNSADSRAEENSSGSENDDELPWY